MAGLLLGAGLCLVLWAVTSPPLPSRSGRWRPALTDLLTQAGAHGVTPGALLALCGATAIVVGLLVTAVTGTPAIAACFGAMAGWAPLALVRSRARARRQALRGLWPDVVDHLASGIRAGLSLPEALAQVGERGPVELRPAFVAFAEDHRVTGRFEESLDALKARLAAEAAPVIEAELVMNAS